MKFTDDDLKWMRKEAERPEIDIGQRIDIEINQQDLIGLLARLEAAEAFINSLPGYMQINAEQSTKLFLWREAKDE